MARLSTRQQRELQAAKERGYLIVGPRDDNEVVHAYSLWCREQLHLAIVLSRTGTKTCSVETNTDPVFVGANHHEEYRVLKDPPVAMTQEQQERLNAAHEHAIYSSPSQRASGSYGSDGCGSGDYSLRYVGYAEALAFIREALAVWGENEDRRRAQWKENRQYPPGKESPAEQEA